MLKEDRLFVAGKSEHLRDHINGRVNVTHEQICRNIRKNIRRQLPQLQPYDVMPNVRVMMLAGGPSMQKGLPVIKRNRTKGWKLVTLNGAHQWCLDNGMTPSAHIMLDARPWNARFVDNAVDSCRYIMASQCDPSVFDKLEGKDLTIWHGVGEEEKPILDRYYNKRYVRVRGGTTVGSRAIWLLYILGFRKIAIYGMDSCLKDFQHHAYEQPENDQEVVHKLRVGRRTFYAHPWMTVQCDEMMQMVPTLPKDLELAFMGDGLLSYCLEYTAKNGRVPKMSIVDEVRRK